MVGLDRSRVGLHRGRWRLLPFIGESKAIVAHAEARLSRDAPPECLDSLVEVALLQVRPPEISPSILGGLIKDILGQRTEDRDGLSILFLMNEDHTVGVLRLSKVALRIDCHLRVAGGLAQTALVGAAPAEVQVEQRD